MTELLPECAGLSIKVLGLWSVLFVGSDVDF